MLQCMSLLLDAVDGSSHRHVSAMNVGAVKAPTPVLIATVYVDAYHRH